MIASGPNQSIEISDQAF